MNPIISQLLEKHNEDIERINKQRRMWLYASSVVLVGIVFLIFSWDWLDQLHSKGVWWVVISLMLVLSINWWYWTMKVIRILLAHHQAAHAMLQALLEDINHIKQDVKLLVNQDIDTTK